MKQFYKDFIMNLLSINLVLRYSFPFILENSKNNKIIKYKQKQFPFFFFRKLKV
jgi:hypothetical protein